MVGKKISVLIFFVLFVIACKTEKREKFTPRIIKGASYVLQVNEKDFFKKHPDYLTARLFSEADIQFFRKTEPSVPAVYHFFTQNNRKMAVVLSPSDSVLFKQGNKKQYQNHTYFQWNFSGKSYYYAFTKDFVLLTDHEILLQKFLRQMPAIFISPDNQSKISAYFNPGATGHWIIFPDNSGNEQMGLSNASFAFKHAGKIHVWDLENAADYHYDGVVFSPDSLRNLSEVFSAVSSFEAFPAELLPRQLGEFTHINFDSFTLFQQAWNDYKTFVGYSNPPVRSGGFKSMKSITQAGKNREILITYFAKPPEKLKSDLIPVENKEGTEIYKTKDSLLAGQIFYPLIRKASYPYVIMMDNYWIWGRKKDVLLNLLQQYEQGRTFIKSDYYKEYFLSLPENYQYVSRSGDKLYSMLWSDNILFESFTVTETATPVHQEKTSGKNKWKKIAVINTGGDFQVYPSWIYNHRSGKYEIIYQNKQNQLVLLDAKGKIRWKKNIGDSLTSPVYQVDMFRNGKRQFLFSTSHAIYVVDILGNYVKPFPVELDMNSPVTLVDYDGNKNYRLIFSSGKEGWVYNLKGKPVKGFNPVKLSSKLQFAPQHLRLGTKDYLFFQQTDGTLIITGRRGKERIHVKEKINVRSPWFVHKNHFVAVTHDGKLAELNQKGEITVTSPGEEIKEAYFTRNHGLIITKGGNIYINGKKQHFPEASYAQPQIYLVNKKPVFVFLDPGSKQIHLLDLQGNHETVPGSDFVRLLVRKNARYIITRYTPGEMEVYYRP